MENIMVFVIVGIVVLLAGWSFYKTLTGKKNVYGCDGNCNSCGNIQSLTNQDKK